MQSCTLTESGQGGGKIFVNVDPDGLGPAGFSSRTFVADTHVGGFDFIPPQPDRSVDAEPGLAWDRTGGAHGGRVYLVYTLEHPNESDNTDIYVQYSDDTGSTWSSPVRVNDDNTTNSQFLPKIALDPTSGNLAVVWYDARADLGAGGPGDTDGVANDDASFWGAFSTDGGQTFTQNIKIAAGTSNSHDAQACRSMAGSRIRRGPTTRTARATTRTGRCTSWTSSPRRCRCLRESHGPHPQPLPRCGGRGGPERNRTPTAWR